MLILPNDAESIICDRKNGQQNCMEYVMEIKRLKWSLQRRFVVDFSKWKKRRAAENHPLSRFAVFSHFLSSLCWLHLLFACMPFL